MPYSEAKSIIILHDTARFSSSSYSNLHHTTIFFFTLGTINTNVL